VSGLDTLEISRWRASLPETMRHGALRSLRQALGSAVKWQWIERNVAADVPNPVHARKEFTPFDAWDEVEAVATELGPFGSLAIFSVGTGVRPEEAFGGEWVDVDLVAGVFTVRRSFAKGRLKQYAKTARSRRRVPLRAKVIEALETLPRRDGILFPASEGRRINIDNFRTREWTPRAEGGRRRAPPDLRHAAHVRDLELGGRDEHLHRLAPDGYERPDDRCHVRRHLARDAEDQDRGLLDAYDHAENGRGHVVGTISGAIACDDMLQNDESPADAGLSVKRAREDSNL
jgi:integrase